MRHRARLAALAALALGVAPACGDDGAGGDIEQVTDTRVGPEVHEGDGAMDTSVDTVADTTGDSGTDATIADSKPETEDTRVEDAKDTSAEDTRPDTTVADAVPETSDAQTASEVAVVACEGDQCEDKNPCTDDLCLAAGGCGYAPVAGCSNDAECIGRAAGAACDDGDAETRADICLVGWCRGFSLNRTGTSVDGGDDSLVFIEIDDRDGTATGWDAVASTAYDSVHTSWALADVSDPEAPVIDADTVQERRFDGLHGGFVGDAGGRLWSFEGGRWKRDNPWDAALGASGRDAINALFTLRGAGVGEVRGARLMWVAGGAEGAWLRFCKEAAPGDSSITCGVQVLGSVDGASLPNSLAGIPECDGAGVCNEASLIVGADAAVGGSTNYTEVYANQNGLAATWSPGFVPDVSASRATRAIVGWGDDNGRHFLVVGNGGYMLVRRASGSFGGPLGLKEGQELRTFTGVTVGAGAIIACAHRPSQDAGTMVYELWVAPSDSELESPGNWSILELGRFPVVSGGPFDIHARGDGEVRVAGAVRREWDLFGRLDGAVWVRTK